MGASQSSPVESDTTQILLESNDDGETKVFTLENFFTLLVMVLFIRSFFNA